MKFHIEARINDFKICLGKTKDIEKTKSFNQLEIHTICFQN